MLTTQLNSQLSVLSTLSAAQAGGDLTLAEQINEQALEYIEDYEQKVADGKSTTDLEEHAAEWVDEVVAGIAAANPVSASAESVFAAIASETAETPVALDLNGQLSILSNVTAEQVGGDQTLADALNEQALEYIGDYATKVLQGKSTVNLEADAAEWVDESVGNIALALAHHALSEGLFADTSGTGETPSTLDLTSQLSVLSTITAEQVGANQDLAEALNAQAAQYIEDYEQKVAEGKSTTDLEEHAAAWVDEAVAEIYMSLTVQALSQSLFATETAETPSETATEEPPVADPASASESSDQTAEESAAQAAASQSGESDAVQSEPDAQAASQSGDSGSSQNDPGAVDAQSSDAAPIGIWERYVARRAESDLNTDRRATTDTAVKEAFQAERATDVIDADEATPVDARLEAMKRALERLQSLSTNVAGSQLLNLFAKTEAEPLAQSAKPDIRADQFDGGGAKIDRDFIATAQAYATARSAMASR